MAVIFTYQEGSILVRLLIAHLLTDFFLQPDKWVKGKSIHGWRSKYLWQHCLFTGFVAAIFLWNLHYLWAILIITITHFFIDAFKLKASASFNKKENLSTETKARKGLQYFINDQLCHIILLVLVWLAIVKGYSRMLLLLQQLPMNYYIWLRLLGYMLVLQPVGYYIGFLTKRWSDELNMMDSLKDAGKWIGMLERLLILTFVYLNQFAAIGFLIAAKSLLRVIDKPDRSNTEPGFIQPFSSRKHTEYVLIGTFLSFSVSLSIGLIINYLANIKL